MGSASLKINEPSMEEILASIRRIIAEDQEAMIGPGAGDDAPSPLRNVLDLAERHVSPIPYPEPLTQDDAGEDCPLHDGGLNADDFIPPFAIDDHMEQLAPRPVVQESKPAPAPSPAQAAEAAPGEPLLSIKASASVSDAFGRLGAAVTPSQPQTMEDFMKEMLRPMLKQWLDDNLPALVERLVQAEIERATRGRG